MPWILHFFPMLSAQSNFWSQRHPAGLRLLICWKIIVFLAFLWGLSCEKKKIIQNINQQINFVNSLWVTQQQRQSWEEKMEGKGELVNGLWPKDLTQSTPFQVLPNDKYSVTVSRYPTTGGTWLPSKGFKSLLIKLRITGTRTGHGALRLSTEICLTGSRG